MVDFYGINVGKYTRSMGKVLFFDFFCWYTPIFWGGNDDWQFDLHTCFLFEHGLFF